MVADQNARYQREQQNNQLLEQYKNQNTVSEFFMQQPRVSKHRSGRRSARAICIATVGTWTSDNHGKAHALAVHHGLYQPLSQAGNRGRKRLCSRGSPARSPADVRAAAIRKIAQPTMNEWEMPLDQLRKQALAAQTGGR